MSGGVVDGDGSSSGGEPAKTPARGVKISLVEVNPGVAIPIARDGAWVDGGGRNAPIPKNRETAFRIRVDVDEAVWTPRDIEAQLSLHLPGGEVQTLSVVETISGDSPENSLDSTLLLLAPAEVMVPLVEFEVELFEAGDSGWQSLPEPGPDAHRATADGPNFVGVESSDQVMRLMLVPIQYESASCTETFDTSPENLQGYEDAMFQQNPVERVELEVHAPFLVNDLELTNANDFFTLAQRIQQLRAQEQPDPDVYYYGIFDNCAQCVGFPGFGGCVLGVAAGLPDDSMGGASERSAIGTSDLQGMGMVVEDIGISTFVHEIGHTQGRQHVECPGVQAGGPDPSYPYAEGKIGVWGYGVVDRVIREAAQHTDYMSYCSPTWVSDWQWEATFDRIRTLSSWGAAGMDAGDQAVLVGAVNTETGESSWWTDRGYLTAPTEGYQLRLRDDDGVRVELPVQASPWSEGPWMTVRAPLHEDFDATRTIEVVTPSRRIEAPREAVSVYYRPDSFTTK